MKRKSIIAILIVAVMALSIVTVFALDYSVPEDAVSVTARFFVTDDDPGDEFTMASEGGELEIYITENTLIYFEDFVPLSDECDGMTQMVREVLFGRTLAEVLDGRNLRILYVEGEQEPISIKVLFETFVTLPETINPDDLDGGYIGIMTLPGEIDWEDESITLNGEIVVNNELLEDATLPFENDGIVMVPLRAVAEALGYDVSWNGYLRSVQLGVAIHVWIGDTEVHFGRMAPIEISTAPILLNNLTFVPLDFFQDVLGQNAYVFEGQVVIETYSDMM